MSYHKIIIVGNLGRDPELRYTPSGQAVTNLNIATSRRWTGGDGQQQEETIWWRVSVWGKQAEACNQYLTKGRQVLIEGRMQPDRTTGEPRIWTDQNGAARSNYEMTAENVRFIGGRDDDGSGGGYNQAQSQPRQNQPQSGGYSQQGQQQGGGYQQRAPQQAAPQRANTPPEPDFDDAGIQEDEIPF